nr:MAG TPA: TetR family transcriptional regulator [Caudoviricetes sp.]
MKLKKIFALCISAVLMMTGCVQKKDTVELSEEEKEYNAVIGWFENDIFDDEEFTDLTDYQYYARTIELEKDELLSPDMWEVYYSDSININKEIDGSAVYLIRLNPDKLLEVWAANNDMTVEEICSELGTNRNDLYYNFGYSANSVGYANNHKENNVSYSETEVRIFGADNGENRQTVFSTHFLKVNIAGRYGVTYAGTDENFDIKQRDLLKSITKPKTYNYSDYSPQEYSPAFVTNGVGIKRILPLSLPNGWANAADTDVTLMFNMSPFSYGCTDEDRIDIFAEEAPENTDVPAEHIEETKGVTE